MSKETKPAPKMSAEKKTSSVELLRKIYFITGTLFEADFERADQMHAQEIEDACSHGSLNGNLFGSDLYYNETFKETKN